LSLAVIVTKKEDGGLHYREKQSKHGTGGQKMAKARIYGQVKTAPPGGYGNMERAWQRKLQKQRNRERAERPLVAAQIAKEKEAQP
jgi:hypothetical protein